MEKRPGTLSKIVGNIVFIVNLLVVLWLALCFAASYISPAEVKYLALCSLTIPFAIVANVFFVLFWLFTNYKARSLYSLIVLLISYQLIITVFGFHYKAEHDMDSGPGRLKIMSWNVHGLGLFNKPFKKEDKNKIAEVIKAEAPDILCLPEYSLLRDGSMEKFTKKIVQENNFNDYKFNIDNTYGHHVILGTMVFSKYPLKDFKVYDLGNMIYLVQSDVQVNDMRTIRMFFVHLYSFGLSDRDRDYIEDVRRSKTQIEEDLGKSKTFISKFNRAWAIRAKEADSIAAIIKMSPYPVVICGDFNDLPGSYTYTAIRGGLNDVFSDKGAGLGRTYNQIFRTLRIDHMFYDDKALQLLGYKSYFNTMSDHNPVIANFRIR